ncbi:NADP-dependent oxidoreductase [Actinacidiphila yeochonensis]|uniref:NADP-dependent oxidoreductase n=1 Tax=Actinacidiphila yeochonensis TaxID=89050 RepID=UPI0005695739|nr:NADP-dependent oxidoreductase [Actinacidiphila yeochonensis]
MNATARAVRFDEYGDRSVLYVADVPVPEPAEGEVVVAVRAAGINPGEASIRSGALRDVFPGPLPSGQGSDLAGVVTAVGPGAGEFAPGDEVLGFSLRRSSHATHVAVPVAQLVPKPEGMDWSAAGALYVIGCTAYAAVRAVDPRPGETVAVSAAAGGVGSVVVQLLAARGVNVLAIASAGNADWLAALGTTPVPYGEGLRERLVEAAPKGVDAFIDLFGPEYLDLAVDLGVPPDRIETIISFARARELGAKAEGSDGASTKEVLAEMAGRVAAGEIEIPVAGTYPLDRVADAFAELERRHTHGKIVLIP